MKKTIILIIILVVILALGIGGYFGVKKIIQIGREKGWDILETQIEKEQRGEGILDKLLTGGEDEVEEENERDVYKSANEVKATGLAEEMNSGFKSILTEAFGGAKLTSFSSGFAGAGTAILEYTVKRVLKAEDGETLLGLLEERNYILQAHTISDGEVGIVALKDDLYITIGYEGGQQEITIIIFKQE